MKYYCDIGKIILILHPNIKLSFRHLETGAVNKCESARVTTYGGIGQAPQLYPGIYIISLVLHCFLLFD